MTPEHREVWREKRTGTLIAVKSVHEAGVLTTDLGGPTDGLENVWDHDQFGRDCERVETRR